MIPTLVDLKEKNKNGSGFCVCVCILLLLLSVSPFFLFSLAERKREKDIRLLLLILLPFSSSKMDVNEYCASMSPVVARMMSLTACVLIFGSFIFVKRTRNFLNVALPVSMVITGYMLIGCLRISYSCSLGATPSSSDHVNNKGVNDNNPSADTMIILRRCVWCDKHPVIDNMVQFQQNVTMAFNWYNNCMDDLDELFFTTPI